jgi:hypothetical protein
LFLFKDTHQTMCQLPSSLCWNWKFYQFRSAIFSSCGGGNLCWNMAKKEEEQMLTRGLSCKNICPATRLLQEQLQEFASWCRPDCRIFCVQFLQNPTLTNCRLHCRIFFSVYEVPFTPNGRVTNLVTNCRISCRIVSRCAR